MKKALSFALLLLVLPALALEPEPLRTQDFVSVDSGRVTEDSILTDEAGLIFLEFLKNTQVKNSETKIAFTGEILPPEIIPAPEKGPRARMREIISFELYADSNEEVSFLDRFVGMSETSRLREELLNPSDFQRSFGVKLLIPIPDEETIIAPSLWSWSNDGWHKVGGLFQTKEEGETSIFSAQLSQAGVFTLFEENPLPSFTPTFPIDEVELVEESPFPSVEESSEGIEDALETVSEFEEAAFEEPFESANQLFEGGEVPAIEEDLFEALEELDEIALDEVPAIEESPEEDTLDPLGLDEVFPINEETFQSAAIPEGATLPSTGPTKERKSLPLFLILCLGILGASLYLGVTRGARS